jgi:predicted MFS family arabinose efflux permease
MAEANAVTAPLFSRNYRVWLLTVLALTNAMNLADRQGIAVIAQAIKLDLRLSDTQMGVIQGLGFAIFYTLLALPLARMAEHLSRVRIIAASLAVFGVMVALCGMAQGFALLLLCRIGVGIGDAGFGPPVASLVGDHYPLQKRASVMSIIWLGAPLGVVVGSMFAGWMAQHYGWRAAFYGIGAPALLISLIAFLTLRDPPRGMSDPGARVGRPPSMWMVLRFLLGKPSVRQMLFGCALATIALNGMGQFLGQFLLRSYHLGMAETGALMALVAGISMSSGLLLGGFGTDRAARHDRRWYVWGPAIGLALAAPWFLLGFTRHTLVSTIAVLMVAHVMLFIYFTPTLATAQNMVGANMRASAAFVTAIVTGLVGIGLGPTALGLLSDLFATRAFVSGDYAVSCPAGAPAADAGESIRVVCEAASATGIRHALMAMSLLLAWAALHYLLAARTLRRDLDTHYAPGRVTGP